MARAALVVLASVLIASLSGCSGTSGITGTVTFNYLETTPSVAKGLEKAVDPSSWVVKCVSRDSSDNKTTVSGAYSSGTFVVAGIPQSQDTICYLLDENSAVKATVSVADTNAVGGRRDNFTLNAGATATLAYDQSAGTGLATPDSASRLSAPSTFGTEDMTYTYTISCSGYPKAYSIVTDDQSDYNCPESLTDATVILHRISSTDANGAVHYNYGVWEGDKVYSACGHTEGLDTAQLPSGWTITSDAARSTAAYTWTSPFTSFSTSSTSAQIAEMIQSATTADGASKSYNTYATEHAGENVCSSVSVCTKNYYYNILQSEAREGALSVCWPELEVSFENNEATFTAKSGGGGSTMPVGKNAFMESFTNGGDLYMRGVETHASTVPGEGEAGDVACSVNSTMLVSIITPGGDPEPHSSFVGKFNQTWTSKAVSGAAADTEKCVANLGADREWTPTGYYSKAEMVKINPIPTP